MVKVTAEEEKIMIYDNLFVHQISQTNHTSQTQPKNLFNPISCRKRDEEKREATKHACMHLCYLFIHASYNKKSY